MNHAMMKKIKSFLNLRFTDKKTRLREYSLCFLIVGLAACSADSPRDDSANTNIQSIVGVAWNLTAFTSSEGAVNSVAEETLYQIMLTDNSNSLRGFVGCVNTSGSYQLFDGSVSLDLGSSNDEACITDSAQFGAQTRDIILLFALSQTIPLTYSIENNTLMLEASDGRLLRFEAIASLRLAE